MKCIEAIKNTVSISPMTDSIKDSMREHIRKDFLFEKKRYICTILATLYEEMSDRPDLQDYVLEAVWLGAQMDRGFQDALWKKRHPKML